MKSPLRLRPLSAAMLCAWLVGCADAEPATNDTDVAEAPAQSGHGDHDATNLEQAAAASDTSGLECHKLLSHAGDGKTPYKVGVKKDGYIITTFKAPWQGTAYGIVFRPIIDNKQVLHHWLLFQTPGTTAPGVAGSIGAHPAGALLAGWAPGGETLDTRELADGKVVGLELPSTSTYSVEFHYNSSDPNAADASGVEICVQKTKPEEVAGLSWLGWDQLGAPAKKWTGTCRPRLTKPVQILGVVPHMHKTGIHMKGTINRANGTKEVLHDKPFDFNYQIQYNVKATINPGDSITTECTFDRPMAFGTGTDAEMCYMFTLAYPKNALADGGIWGTLAHGAGACLGQ